MKHNQKSRKMNDRFSDYDDEDEYPIHTSHKKDSPRRRPVRNWKKAWVDHSTNFDEVDDFFGK